jgi:hypothetical protein
VPRTPASLQPGLDLAGESERRGQSRGTRTRKVRVQEGRENHDRARYAELPELLSLLYRSDAITPWLEWLERAQRSPNAEPVSIGLYHREEWHSRAPRNRGSITLQRAQIDFDQGAS